MRYAERPTASFRWVGWLFVLLVVPPFTVDALFVRNPADASGWIAAGAVIAAVAALNPAYLRRKQRIRLTSDVLRADGRRIRVELLDLPRLAARHQEEKWPAGPFDLVAVRALHGRRCELLVPLRFGSYYPVPTQDAGALAHALGRLAVEIAGPAVTVEEPVVPGVRCPSPFGTVFVDRTEPPRQLTVAGPAVPTVTLASTVPLSRGAGDSAPWIGTRAGQALALQIDGRFGTVRPRREFMRRATFQVRATADGHEYLLDPTSMAKAQLLRDGSRVARMSWFRPSPLRPYPVVTWELAATPADVSVGLALSAGFGVGAEGMVFHLLELFVDLVEFFSFWRYVVRFVRFIGSMID